MSIYRREDQLRRRRALAVLALLALLTAGAVWLAVAWTGPELACCWRLS